MHLKRVKEIQELSRYKELFGENLSVSYGIIEQYNLHWDENYYPKYKAIESYVLKNSCFEFKAYATAKSWAQSVFKLKK